MNPIKNSLKILKMRMMMIKNEITDLKTNLYK